ncbi:hypothetical protein [Anoxynatronum sibiricum]|uniref:Uncharacterized protein n=1 Tax=Anoxynatronum sibiricum TaxID=210623 RepID=A0ABU9VXW8_9CLOT
MPDSINQPVTMILKTADYDNQSIQRRNENAAAVFQLPADQTPEAVFNSAWNQTQTSPTEHYQQMNAYRSDSLITEQTTGAFQQRQLSEPVSLARAHDRLLEWNKSLHGTENPKAWSNAAEHRPVNAASNFIATHGYSPQQVYGIYSDMSIQEATQRFDVLRGYYGIHSPADSHNYLNLIMANEDMRKVIDDSALSNYQKSKQLQDMGVSARFSSHVLRYAGKAEEWYETNGHRGDYIDPRDLPGDRQYVRVGEKPLFRGEAYAYVDAYGMTRIETNLAQAIQKSPESEIYEYEGYFRSGHPANANGDFTDFAIAGSRPVTPSYSDDSRGSNTRHGVFISRHQTQDGRLMGTVSVASAVQQYKTQLLAGTLPSQQPHQAMKHLAAAPQGRHYVASLRNATEV